MDPDYHPEIDTTPFLSEDETSKYRMLIGCGLWAVTLGRFDIQYAVSTLAQFNMSPRQGHFEAALRIFGYLRAFSKGKIVIDTRKSNNQLYKTEKHNWEELYPGAHEEIPKDLPEVLWKYLHISTPDLRMIYRIEDP